MNRAFLIGLALLVSLLILSSVVSRPSGLGRREASPGWSAWRIVKEPPLIIPDWKNHLPDRRAVDDSMAIVERIRQISAAGALNTLSAVKVINSIYEPYSVIYNANEFTTETFPSDFRPNTTGPDDVTVLLDAMPQVLSQVSHREKAIDDAAAELARTLEQTLKTLDRAQRAMRRERDESAATSLEEYIDAVRSLAAKASSDIARERESLADIRSRFDLFYDNLAYRLGLVSWDDAPVAKPVGSRRAPDSIVGNAIVFAVNAKEPWLRQYAKAQLDFWQPLYPEARLTLEWLGNHETELAAAFAAAPTEYTEQAEAEGLAGTFQKLIDNAPIDPVDPCTRILGYTPLATDPNATRLTLSVNTITAAVGTVTPEDIAAEAGQLLRDIAPGLTLLDAIEWLAKEATAFSAEGEHRSTY